MKVAIKDASEGTDAVNDLDGAAAKFAGPDLISSPTSDW